MPTQHAPDTKKKIQLEIVRQDGKTYFSFNIDQKIENLYKQQSEELRTSTSWPELKFYSIPELLENDNYRRMLNNYRLYDDYGSGITSNGRFNIAWLRTVGGKGKIKVTSTLTIAELSTLVQNTTAFIKEYFEGYFKNCVIKGSVNIEI